jgi:peptidyl-prolyl cis-trans isomerase C
MRAARLAREPLVQFLVLGLVLFAVERAWNGPAAADPEAPITVSIETVAVLSADFAAREGRKPTPDERALIIEDYADQERLLREGRALGLDVADPVVRRRVIQKTTFLVEHTPSLPEPTDAELQAWLDRHPERYARAPRCDGVQIFVDPARHPDPEGRAAALVARVASGEDAGRIGDPLPTSPTWSGLTLGDLERRYGLPLADAAAAAAPGTWNIVRSTLGWHAVQVTAWAPGGPRELTAVRDQVSADWETAQRARRREAALIRLRARWPTAAP